METLPNVITAILSIFSGIAEWFTEAVPSVLGLFYVDGTGLTVLGALLVVSLAISVVMMLVAIVRSFFTFSAH